MLLRLVTALALGTATLTALADDHAHGHQAVEGALIMTQVWSRAMPPTAPTGAVYFNVRNLGDKPDRLVGVQTSRAEIAEMHTHVHTGEMMRMERIDSVEVPAGGDVAFKPGGNHVMLFKPNTPLAAGETFPLTLIFERSGEMTVDVPIQDGPPEASDNTHQHH